MRLHTRAIAFPPQTWGLEAITDTLVRKFWQTYKNVFTFYLAAPPIEALAPVMHWLRHETAPATQIHT